MTTAPPHITVGLTLDHETGAALDQAAGEAMQSRAGLVRRILTEGLRASGHLPELPTGPRPVARYRPVAR